MALRISVNVITNMADEWFDSIEEADKYCSTLEEGEELHEYLVYHDGIWQP